MVALLLAACASTCPSPDVVLTDAGNYAVSGTLDVASVDVAAATDLRLDWSAATTDLQGHALDPAADIDLVSIVAFPGLDEAGVEAALAEDTLLQQDLGGYAFVEVDGVTEVQLASLTLLGNDIDIEAYLTEGSATWMLLLSSGTTPGVGTRLLQFLRPLDASANTDVLLTSASGTLTLDVELDALTPVVVPTGEPLTVDVSGVTLDGRGHAFDAGDVDTLDVGWFAEAALADLEAGFLDVREAADRRWESTGVSGPTFALADAGGPDGDFVGVSGEGTWVLALSCATCTNPAPLYFTELVGCE